MAQRGFRYEASAGKASPGRRRELARRRRRAHQLRANNICGVSQNGGRHSGIDDKGQEIVLHGDAEVAPDEVAARQHARMDGRVARRELLLQGRVGETDAVLAVQRPAGRHRHGMMSTWNGMPEAIRSFDPGRIGVWTHSSCPVRCPWIEGGIAVCARRGFRHGPEDLAAFDADAGRLVQVARPAK